MSKGNNPEPRAGKVRWGKEVKMEEMTVLEMQRFLNQQYAEGKTELEALRNLMAILGLTYPQKKDTDNK